MARRSHPNIVIVHDFGEADGMFFLLMEYVDGMTLRQWLREGRMKPEEALAITQIRHSRGRLYGLGLAVFDAMLFPLLILNGLLSAGWNFAANPLADAFIPHLGRALCTILVLGLMAASCVAASGLIIRAVWRAVNKPVGGGKGSP